MKIRSRLREALVINAKTNANFENPFAFDGTEVGEFGDAWLEVVSTLRLNLVIGLGRVTTTRCV
jgi:hypothetical protein